MKSRALAESMQHKLLTLKSATGWKSFLAVSRQVLPAESARLMDEKASWKGEFMRLYEQILKLEESIAQGVPVDDGRFKYRADDVAEPWEPIHFPSDCDVAEATPPTKEMLPELCWLACKCGEPFKLPIAYFAEAVLLPWPKVVWLLAHVFLLRSTPWIRKSRYLLQRQTVEPWPQFREYAALYGLFEELIAEF
ncbi:MAG: hypothetical protein LQ340_000378 [Diploschistes diacapsis]|nr:MAG: hypothetical protein LQ340_000378 [Diploschistes diacapsis]